MPSKIIPKLFTCANCGVEFTRTGNRMGKKRNGENADHIFCSRGCYDEFRVQQRKEKANNCRNCGKPIDKPGKGGLVYCDKKCKDEFNQKRAHKKCQVCGVEFCAIKPSRDKDGKVTHFIKDKNKKCCSRECLKRFMSEDEDRKSKVTRIGADHHNWQGGLQGYRKGYRGPGWAKIAEECRERYGRVCAICGKTEKENGRKLDVNHIIPWHQMTDKVAANKQSNLEALCRVCHTSKDRKYKRENPIQLLMPLV